MTDYTVKLVRREDNALIEAVLHDGMQPSDLIDVEKSWHSARQQLINDLKSMTIPPREWPQSLLWDWSRKAPQLDLLQATGFGIICEGNWEGMMLTKTATMFARHSGDIGKPLIYVDFLESAPWNWSVTDVGQNGRYKGIGSILVRQAVLQSFDEGFHGRVGLHSLPQTEKYYETACGMTSLGQDSQKQNLMYFEFTKENADKYLKVGGAK